MPMHWKKIFQLILSLSPGIFTDSILFRRHSIEDSIDNVRYDYLVGIAGILTVLYIDFAACQHLVMNFYREAVTVLEKLEAKKGSIKGIIGSLPEKSRKRTAALVIETLKCTNSMMHSPIDSACYRQRSPIIHH